MDKSKEQFQKAVGFMKQEKYKEAIDYLDILLLRDCTRTHY